MKRESIETRHLRERDELFDALKGVSRRSFIKLAAVSAGVAAARGLVPPHSFQPVRMADAGFSFAYISDSHLYDRKINARFVKSLLKAVDDVNALSPQPDFVVYGGDLAQLGQREELELGAQILASLKAPIKMVVGEHSPLYKYYRPWNFWTDDADQVQALLEPFDRVTVIHGHTHQLLTHRIGRIHFHGMLSTAWPWPYAPEGLPALTVERSRPDPFSPLDGCGDGRVAVNDGQLIEKIYNLWSETR